MIPNIYKVVSEKRRTSNIYYADSTAAAPEPVTEDSEWKEGVQLVSNVPTAAPSPWLQNADPLFDTPLDGTELQSSSPPHPNALVIAATSSEELWMQNIGALVSTIYGSYPADGVVNSVEVKISRIRSSTIPVANTFTQLIKSGTLNGSVSNVAADWSTSDQDVTVTFTPTSWTVADLEAATSGIMMYVTMGAGRATPSTFNVVVKNVQVRANITFTP